MPNTAPLRVCLFTPTFLPSLGGAELAGDRILQGLQQRGHEVQVLCQDHGVPPELPYPVTRYRRPPAQHLWPELLCRHVRRVFQQRPFDVMLAFYGYPTGYAAARLKDRLGFKLVVSARGADLYPNFHALSKPRVRSVIRAGYREADRIISLSHWLDQRLKEVAGPDLPPIDRVMNGIDLVEFDSALRDAESHTSPADLQPGRFVLHLARVGPVKRQDLAVKAIVDCAELFRQKKFRYVFAGDGESLETIRQQVKNLGISDIVRLPGRQTGLDKMWLLRHAYAFVSTSREEGMPNAMIEAIAAGLPVLASDIGPHRELLELSQAGWTFRFPEVHDLSRQIQRLLSIDLTPYCNAAHQARHLFSLDRMIDGYERSLQCAVSCKTNVSK